MKVALCIPTCGDPTWQLLDSIARFQAYHYARHPEIGVDVIRPPRSLPVDIARSYLVDKVLQADYDYLWFVDQDCEFLPPTLERLMARGVGIVGTLCMMRGPEECWPMLFKDPHPDKAGSWLVRAQEVHDFSRLFYNCRINAPQILAHPPEGSLFEADVTGCHCLLIERAVLEALDAPWFHGLPGQEDMYFCRKAIEAGFKVYVDLAVLAGHGTGARTIGLFDFMAHFRYVAELEAANIGEDGTED